MPQPMHKIILQTYCDRHRKLLAFVEEMTDAQLRWLPQPCGNSIAFNLWHLARCADWIGYGDAVNLTLVSSQLGLSAAAKSGATWFDAEGCADDWCAST